MARHIALLRAINVGGHTVAMGRLRSIFVSLGFENVETFIASGNVLFDLPGRQGAALDKRIERALRDELGYEVATFLRTPAELAAVAGHPAFPAPHLAQAGAFNVAFLSAPLDAPGRKKLAALTSDLDEFHTHGREVYWLCRTRQSDSSFSNAVLEKTLGRPSTIRGMNTVRRLVAKLES